MAAEIAQVWPRVGRIDLLGAMCASRCVPTCYSRDAQVVRLSDQLAALLAYAKDYAGPTLDRDTGKQWLTEAGQRVGAPES